MRKSDDINSLHLDCRKYLVSLLYIRAPYECWSLGRGQIEQLVGKFGGDTIQLQDAEAWNKHTSHHSVPFIYLMMSQLFNPE